MHCWILINIRLEYKDMKYFLGMPIFSVLQGLSDQNFGDMEMLQHLNFDKDIFIPKHIIESNKKNDYLSCQCDDLWVAFHQSGSINWEVG